MGRWGGNVGVKFFFSFLVFLCGTHMHVSVFTLLISTFFGGFLV